MSGWHHWSSKGLEPKVTNKKWRIDITATSRQEVVYAEMIRFVLSHRYTSWVHPSTTKSGYSETWERIMNRNTNAKSRLILQTGPLPVVSTVITPLFGVIVPVTVRMLRAALGPTFVGEKTQQQHSLGRQKVAVLSIKGTSTIEVQVGDLGVTSKHDCDVDSCQNLAYIVLPFLKNYKCPHIIYACNYLPLYIVIPYILDTQKKTHIFVRAKVWEIGEINIVWKGSWPFLKWPDFGVCPTCGSGSKWSKTLDGINFNWLTSSNLSR